MLSNSGLHVYVSGLEPVPAQTVRCTGNVSKQLSKYLPNLSENTPLLINAQVGFGKTYAVVHTLLPWALQNDLKILYVSSRVANNMQIKKEIVTVTNEQELLDEHTVYGLRRQNDFKGISVVTYHRLYHMMRYEVNKLKEYRVLVFDEIHALLEDAHFVPYTGYIMTHLMKCCGAKARIYMSGTCDGILPHLVKMEGGYQLTVLSFPRSFAYVKPKFFREESTLIDHINADNSKNPILLITCVRMIHLQSYTCQSQICTTPIHQHYPKS